MHERSEQSDLLLACVRELMLADRRLNHLRLVLMSATFDSKRYIEYFSVLGLGDRMRQLAIPKPGGAVGALFTDSLFQVQVHYLEEAISSAGQLDPGGPAGAGGGQPAGRRNRRVGGQDAAEEGELGDQLLEPPTQAVRSQLPPNKTRQSLCPPLLPLHTLSAFGGLCM